MIKCSICILHALDKLASKLNTAIEVTINKRIDKSHARVVQGSCERDATISRAKAAQIELATKEKAKRAELVALTNIL